MTTRKPKQEKALPDLEPRNSDGLKGGSTLSPAETAAGLSPSQQAQQGSTPAPPRGGLGGALRPR